MLSCLVDGNSINSTGRMIGAAKMTVLKFLVDVGRACAEYQDTVLRNLKIRRLQYDETWSFIGAKQQNVATANHIPMWVE